MTFYKIHYTHQNNQRNNLQHMSLYKYDNNRHSNLDSKSQHNQNHNPLLVDSHENLLAKLVAHLKEQLHRESGEQISPPS